MLIRFFKLGRLFAFSCFYQNEHKIYKTINSCFFIEYVNQSYILMKRTIVDYKKLTHDILELLVEKFPDGYEDGDIISFRNASNEVIEAVEVRTDDTIYLVKVSKRLADTMEGYDDDFDEEDEDNEKPIPVADDDFDDDLQE